MGIQEDSKVLGRSVQSDTKDRRGKKKSIIVLGHKIPIAAYFIIKDKVEYKELGKDYLSNFRRDQLISYYKKQIDDFTLTNRTESLANKS